MYPELIDLLTSRMLDPQERDDIAQQVAAAPDDPEYEWADGDAAMASSCELLNGLADFAATSDKIDELHEQIQDMFDEDFPEFPAAAIATGTGGRIDLTAYFSWLDGELAGRAVEEGGYEAVIFDTGADDNMSVFVVDRNDTDRIVQLAGELGLRIDRPAHYLRNP